jgi:hypothetical protein
VSTSADDFEELIWDVAGEILGTNIKPAEGHREGNPLYGARTVKRGRRTNAELAVVDAAIVDAVAADHPVTLRGVYYRVVSAGAVPKTENGYRLVGRQLLKLRRVGVIPYSWVTDGTRWIKEPLTWSNLDEMLEDAASSYRRALWHNQDTEVYVFTEKDAVSGVVRPVADRWDVPYGVLRGYSSESFSHGAAAVIKAAVRRGKGVYVYELGDHDPSGIDLWRAFVDRTREFLIDGIEQPRQQGRILGSVDFERLAVTEDQIETLGLPTRPTKQTDTRSKTFVGGSVEVDAIPAPTLRQIVEDAITQHIDAEALRLTRLAEQSERDVLTRMIGNGS